MEVVYLILVLFHAVVRIFRYFSSFLLSWRNPKRVFVLGLHNIEIENRLIKSADIDALRECLEKQCAGLTSNHKNGHSLEESLVLSLLQHYTSRYWLDSLDYASLIVTTGLEWLEESTWNKFRASAIDCHGSSESITAQQVTDLSKKFHQFWVQQHSTNSFNPEIICFGLDKDFKLSSESTSYPPTIYHFWYDKKTKCFEAITRLSNFYPDTASYWEHLILRAEICFDQFFKMEFGGLSDDKLESRFNERNEEIKSIGNTFDSFKRQFEKWKIGDEFHHIVLDMENCISSPDENSKDSTSTWCEQLWQITARCLVRQCEQAFIDEKRKIEMKRRETNSEIDKIQENIERLNREIAKARQRVNAIDRRAADEDILLEQLAWNQLLLDLANPGFVPDYKLACERQNHEIFKEGNACLLAVKVNDLLHPSSTTANKERRATLEKYTKRQSNTNQILKELRSALDKFVGREINNGTTRNQILTINGESSVVLRKIASSVNLYNCREIVIKAERVIYVDCDWTVPGISVTLSAPLIHITSSPGVSKRTITTSGRDGIEHENLKANNGNGGGASGSHGLAGQDGEDAGNVNLHCQNWIGRLKIVARGGKGADGQDGGDGQPGHKGYDGQDGTYPTDQEEGYNWYTFGDIDEIVSKVYSNSGWPGKSGGDGGSGGNGGKGGRGGFGGQVKSSRLKSNNYLEIINADGQNGDDGQPGRWAPGGSGGIHGVDTFLYFDPNDPRPHIWNTGHWRYHKGSRNDLKVQRYYGRGITIGYKVCCNSSSRRAVEGKRGTEGKKATDQLQQKLRTSNSQQTTSQFPNQIRSDEYEREKERQSGARRRDEQQRARENESINRMSRDVVGERNAISRHEQSLVADQQRLKSMEESRQRVQAKMQETFEQRIAQQSVVGQRITRQVKLNLDDQSLSASLPIDLGLDIRSGRPVTGKLTSSALHCLAKLDALLISKGDNNNLLQISELVQSLVLNLGLDKHDNEWNSIEKIISQISKTGDAVDSLEFIASNLPLISSLVDQSLAGKSLIKMLYTFLAAPYLWLTYLWHRLTLKETTVEKDVISILHKFHQGTIKGIKVQQVINFIREISDWTQQSHILLGLFLDKWLLSTITQKIFVVLGNNQMGDSRARLIAEFWLHCSPLLPKWNKCSGIQTKAVNEWFQHVQQFVSQLQHERSSRIDELLMRFDRDRLGIDPNISEIKMVFIVQHLLTKGDELEEIAQWARKNYDRHLMALTERTFNGRFLAPIRKEIQFLIQNQNWTEDQTINTDIEEAIHRLYMTIQSSFTDLSFEKRLQLGRDLKGKLEVSESNQSQFLNWIKPLSEKCVTSTAELFVAKNKSDGGETILSLLSDSKKFEKKNVMLELHYRLTHLSASLKPIQIEKLAAGILLDKLSDPLITDEFNRYHWHCFRSTFLENWSHYFFCHWSHCYQETEHLRDKIAGKNPDDDDQNLNSLQLALERYLLFTSGLPPYESVEKWRQLQSQSSDQERVNFIVKDLEQAIKEVESTIPSRIDQLRSNKLLKKTTNGKYFSKDIVDLVDVLFEIISRTTVSFFNDARSVQSLHDVIETAQMIIDLTIDETPNTSSQMISSAKLNEWKKELVQWKVKDGEAAASIVYLAVKDLIKSAEFNSSSEDDYSKEIYMRISARRRKILASFNEALSWLQTFVGYLTDTRSGIDTLTVIKSTVKFSQYLSWDGLKKEKTSLLQVAIEILTTSTTLMEKPENPSWISFFGAIVNSFFGAILNFKSNEITIWLMMKLAIFVGGQLSNDRKRATWCDAKCWFFRLELHIIIDKDDKNHLMEELMGIQQVLIDYCSACYEMKLLDDCEKRSKKMDLKLVSFSFKNTVERWTNIVRFVRSKKNTSSSEEDTDFLKHQLEIRQLVLKGLIQLGQSDSFYWDEQSVNDFLKSDLIPELEPSSDKKYILSEMLSGTRKAFVQRWIYLENCADPERIRGMEKALQDKTGSLNDAQLFFSTIGYDLFTDKEKSYINLIGDGPAVESSLLIDGQHPSCFLGALQKLAIERIRTELIHCFEHQNIGRSFLPDKPHIRQLCRSFNRLIHRKKEEDEELLLYWLHWIRDVVIPSLNSYQANQGLSVHQLIKFFQDVEGFPLDLCRAATTKCRPHQWIDFLAIFAIENLLDQLNEKCRDEDPAKSSDIIRQLIQWWSSSGAPSSFLHTFYHKIRQEMAGDPLQLMTLVQQVTNQLTTLELHEWKMHDDVILGRFSGASLNDWSSVLRYAQLAVDWTPELALHLTAVLDVQFGQQRTDQFLRLLVHHYPKSENNKTDDLTHLTNILRNLIRYPWIKDQWIALIDKTFSSKSVEVEDLVWQSLSDTVTIVREMEKSSQVDVSIEDITTIMRQDPESSKVIVNPSEMAQRIASIRQDSNNPKYTILTYLNLVRTDATKSQPVEKPNSGNKLNVDDFLAVACGVVQKEKGYVPRDVQLIAVITFFSSDSHKNGQMPRRILGQISTGEGKTLISALVAIYHVLSHWNEDKHVNIITSSPVLAEANIAEIGWLFKAFGVSVSNNCDQICSNDDNIRRERYNSDVIYGDLGSFMRDILLTKYFEDKDVTRNRIPGAIIVDEVDSMTLDKGENVLYMTHNIPEMYDLMNLFVQIWTLVNAPDVIRLAESSNIVDEIRQMIEPMIPSCVPNGLKKFSERHLSTWIKSAFRAAYLLQPDDAYKVDDCGDGQGRRIVIMDKETGVEQVQTEWSDGLQQFLQLKHGMKWTPISLKAIFMSNIGYFSEFQGRMYGLTGTLGSTAECNLLRQVFGVDFFRLPRFRPRFCIQHEPIIAHDRKNWLDQMQQTIVSVASSSTKKNQQRSVLVVCDNIESADSIYNHLMKTNANQIKVVKYVSSFDESFKQNQHHEMLPGQVIIATNLAGRGTDLKPSKELLNNGGLHVIIGFLPPNARVEAQAEGRTARCGQTGSFQFIIENVNDKMSQSGDPYGRMLQLKSKRDDDERLRLDNIRRESLPKIQMEEKLFHKFYEKCICPLKNLKHLKKDHRTIMRNCLNNRWAFWLDENAGLIEKAHRNPVFNADLKENFDRLTMSVQSSDVELIFSSPSEWMGLARFYEESSLPTKAAKYYTNVIEIEPKWCENALLDLARLTLAESAGYSKKMVAKGYLKRARKLIDDRIETLTSLNQEIDQCLKRQMERGSALCHKRFEEQVMNQIRLWRIHSSKIDNLLGVPLKSALAAVLPTEEDQHIDEVIELLDGRYFMKPRRYSKKVDCNSFNWPPFVVHYQKPLEGLARNKNCNLADFEDAIIKVEQNLWQKLISVYIDNGQEYGGGKIIKLNQNVDNLPDNVISKSYQRILPGWLKYHDGQNFALVSSTLGIEDVDQLKKLEKWMDEKNLLKVADRCIRHRMLKPIPSMDQDPEIQLVKGVALSSCADVVSAWFSSPISERNGEQYILPPPFDERKKKLAKQLVDYLVDVGVIKDPAIKFPSAKSERSREDVKEDLEKITNSIKSLGGLERLAKLFYSEDKGTTKQKKEKLSAALAQAVDIHLGQLKTLSQVKSSFCSLHAGLPPPSDDQSSPTEEVQQFNNQHLDRVLQLDEHVSRWDWRIGLVALMGVAQLVGSIAFPFFSTGLVGEGINDLMFAFQCFTSPGSFSWKAYLVDKAKSLALTAITMGVGAARLVKACGGSLKQAAKLMCRFNGTLKGWIQAGKHILIQCANIISSSIIGQAVSRFLTWLNKFIMEQVLERIKSFLFNNKLFRPAFNQLKELMTSLMNAMVKSGKSAGEASQTIKRILDQSKEKLAAGDWFTELRTNASSITSRMMRIFNDSSAGLSSLQSNYVGENQLHASTRNVKGITASVNAGTIEKAIKMGKTIVDYGKKVAEVTETINKLTTVTKLATHGLTYIGDLNAALQDELRKLKLNNKQMTGGNDGELSAAEKKRFEKFVDETEGEIQSSIMQTTLDTIQTTWVQPMIQRKVERSVSKIGSKLVQKYCPSILPEGFDKPTNRTDESTDDNEIPAEDQWIDGMGNGKPAGPVEIQNAVDASGIVLEIEDNTEDKQYTKGSEGNTFKYNPEGNPYSDKPIVKMSFTQNEDGTKHVSLIMPDGTKHEFVPDPSDPPDRCFYDALSKAQNKSVDETINKLKNHAKGNDRTRFMNNLGVNQSYQHLQVGAYRKERDGKTTYVIDIHKRVVGIITTESQRKQERNAIPRKVKENKGTLDFQPGDVYSHDISLNSGGVDDVRNISRMTHECNRYLYREHEEMFEKACKQNQENGSPEVITRVITRHYEHTASEISRMVKQGKNPDLYKTKGYEHDFYTGPPNNPTNLYKSGVIPNWSGQQASRFYTVNRDSRKMKRTDARRSAANAPSHVVGPLFEKLLRK